MLTSSQNNAAKPPDYAARLLTPSYRDTQAILNLMETCDQYAREKGEPNFTKPWTQDNLITHFMAGMRGFGIFDKGQNLVAFTIIADPENEDARNLKGTPDFGVKTVVVQGLNVHPDHRGKKALGGANLPALLDDIADTYYPDITRIAKVNAVNVRGIASHESRGFVYHSSKQCPGDDYIANFYTKAPSQEEMPQPVISGHMVRSDNALGGFTPANTL